MTDKTVNATEQPLKSAIVSISFPCAAEYVSVARLAILGIASRLPFSYDEVEDVRLAVGEACTHAIERSTATQRSAPTSDGLGTITIVSTVTATDLEIVVTDDVPTGAPGDVIVDDEFADLDIDRQGLGALLIEILVDEVEVTTTPQGTSVRLLKRSPVA